MNLLVPAALAFSAIIPIILVLYFMRPKRQERVVGSTLLWRQALQDLQASHPWQRLRITPLLLLQLLAAIVIILVLTRPAIFTNSPVSGDTIIILQSSASMQATDVTPNRFENAKNTIADFISNIGPNDRLSLITMDRIPQVLIADSQDKDQLMAALQRARVTNQDADLQDSLALAASLAQGHSNAQVVVVGDGHIMNPDQGLIVPFPVRYLRIGTDAPNAALMALSARTVQNKLTAFAQVANYSHQQRAIPIELYADGKLVGVQTVTLSPETSGSVQWTPLPATTRLLHARLITQDAMTVDHEAWAIVGGSLHARVLLVTKGNIFLETALRLQSNIDLYETTPDKYVNVYDYDLTVFDGYVPPKLPQGSLFFVNPPNGSYSFGAVGQIIHVNQSHLSVGNDPNSLLSGVDLSSVHVLNSSHQFKPASWAQTIINATETPLLLAGENNTTRIAALGFDLHQSDLPLQPSFPILINNLTSWLLPSPVAQDGQVTAGAPVTVQTWPGADQVKIIGPDQQVTTVGPPFPVSPYTQTNTIGIYQVTQRVHGRILNAAFTVNLFDPAQSSLAPANALPVLHSTNFSTGGNTVSRQLREIWPWIAAFLLLVLCAEWWFFSRSYRFQASPAHRRAPSGGPGRDSRTLAQGTGAYKQQRRSRNTFIASLQDELQESYARAKKRTLKITRGARSKLRLQSKGGRQRVKL
ncbi:MAG TPA: BatA and WFA domain-containing protein [Ktedonobacteraceae bacterium]|nr:BatA and WFA domain-containing protein [Ktedonobacteraceae bacterium]